ncbi:hypothetical protein QYF36_019204 [Acer negundo]|nr:hypothetical protein QYF36_019204 [Acer negundo]
MNRFCEMKNLERFGWSSNGNVEVSEKAGSTGKYYGSIFVDKKIDSGAVGFVSGKIDHLNSVNNTKSGLTSKAPKPKNASGSMFDILSEDRDVVMVEEGLLKGKVDADGIKNNGKAVMTEVTNQKKFQA